MSEHAKPGAEGLASRRSSTSFPAAEGRLDDGGSIAVVLAGPEVARVCSSSDSSIRSSSCSSSVVSFGEDGPKLYNTVRPTTAVQTLSMMKSEAVRTPVVLSLAYRPVLRWIRTLIR